MIPVSIPFISKNQKKYVNDCLDRNWISSFGKYDKLLCENFSSFVGSKYASSCSNGTVALHLALLACEVSYGDEVIMPNFNSPYALFSCAYVGAVPIAIDISNDRDININQLKRAISKKTKAIIIPHLYGIPTRIEPIIEICKENKIFIIEDCAEAHGAKEKEKMVGFQGDISCFSFYSNKIISSGEGGICVTSDPDLYEKINYIKNQTFNKGPIKTFIHKHVGYNYRMSDIHCAIAFSHLEQIDYILDQRNKILHTYKKCMPNFNKSFQINKKNTSSVNWVTTFELPENKSKLRDKLESFLIQNGIQTRRYFANLTDQPIFTKMNGRCFCSTPISKNLSKSGIYLPTYIGIKDKEVKNICNTIKQFFSNEN